MDLTTLLSLASLAVSMTKWRPPFHVIVPNALWCATCVMFCYQLGAMLGALLGLTAVCYIEGIRLEMYGRRNLDFRLFRRSSRPKTSALAAVQKRVLNKQELAGALHASGQVAPTVIRQHDPASEPPKATLFPESYLQAEGENWVRQTLLALVRQGNNLIWDYRRSEGARFRLWGSGGSDRGPRPEPRPAKTRPAKQWQKAVEEWLSEHCRRGWARWISGPEAMACDLSKLAEEVEGEAFIAQVEARLQLLTGLIELCVGDYQSALKSTD